MPSRSARPDPNARRRGGTSRDRRIWFRAIAAVLAGFLVTAAMPAGAGHAASTGRLQWGACRLPELKGLQCATFTVPRDYADSAKGTFDLALMRVRSTGSASERIGTLFVNLGGPGVSVRPFAAAFLSSVPADVRARFDVVLWDPRGVGMSNGLAECTGGSYRLPATGNVDWAAVSAEMSAAQRAANVACAARYPDVVPYIGTNSTVRDLEAMRVAVGDAKLTYWGTSYGTRIGYVYAHNYPDRVRAMLLSSSIDPHGTWTSFAYQAALAPDTALSFEFEAMPGTQAAYRRSLATLDSRVLTLPSGTELTRWTMRATMSELSVSESRASDLRDYIAAVDTALHGSGQARAKALRVLDAITEPMPTMEINGGSIPFIGCSDYADRPSADQQVALAARIRGQAPIVGWGASMGLYYCDGMTFEPSPVPVDFTDWTTPMLIIGSTRDSLTPYGWTVDMARTFRNSRVVSYVGSTHTAYLSGSPCVDRYGTEYLVSLRRPAVDVACPSTLPARLAAK